ncbi:hypothetical protein GZH49_22130 [Nocardia terpenica]|uniref:hypothetical protein n=1 Tax=Nocardia terpenica TaxID=455432 RepID=UPI002FE3DED9
MADGPELRINSVGEDERVRRLDDDRVRELIAGYEGGATMYEVYESGDRFGIELEILSNPMDR